ncbi:MAG TPA: hypothetical protein VF837_05625 [Patescibacteria group bacterium]
MVYDLSLSENVIAEKAVKEGIDNLSNFFEIKFPEIPDIYLVGNRKTINALKGMDTQPWVVGFGKSETRSIYLLHPDKYQSESNHVYSDDYFFTLVKHELCHKFYNQFAGDYRPRWLSEGVCIYTSGQKRKPISKVEWFLKFFQGSEPGIEHVYEEAGLAVKILHDNFGKKKLLEFIKKGSQTKNSDELSVVFEEIYNKKMDYETFNELIKPN